MRLFRGTCQEHAACQDVDMMTHPSNRPVALVEGLNISLCLMFRLQYQYAQSDMLTGLMVFPVTMVATTEM